jgi:flavin reductase (DIM6/NTAB) family NADH-FMN oxidoreductase RutF
MTRTAAPDPRAFRHALGRFATGVTVITTRDETGRPVGLTANSFSAVSLDPPLVAWSLGLRSGSLPVFLAALGFAINVLGEEQEELSRRFASPLADRFAGVAWRDGIGGAPVLGGCLAVFECRTARRIEAGDHWLFLGEVLGFAYGDDAPLLFYASRYGLPRPCDRAGKAPCPLAA